MARIIAFSEDRISHVEDIRDLRSYGAGISFNHSLGLRTSFDSTLSWTHRETPSSDPVSGDRAGNEGEDDHYRVFVDLTHDLGEATSLTLSGRYDVRSSKSDPIADFDAILVGLHLQRTF